jgi:uncharacterized membrane protein
MEKKGKEVPPIIYKNNPKVISIISYLTIVGWLLGYVLNDQKSPLASFHQRQSLGVYLVFLVSSMLMWIPILGWIAGVLVFLLGLALWLIGISDAFREKMDAVPILGVNFQKWFAGL